MLSISDEEDFTGMLQNMDDSDESNEDIFLFI